MTFTIQLAWWAIPTGLSILAFLLAVFWPTDAGDYGLGMLCHVILAMLFVMVVWIVTAVVK